MSVEEFLKRIKMSAFQASIVAILSIMSIYTVYRSETFIIKIHKVMATLNRSMIQTERAMVHLDRAEAVSLTLVEHSTQLAPVADKEKPRPKAKAAPRLKVSATVPSPTKPTAN